MAAVPQAMSSLRRPEPGHATGTRAATMGSSRRPVRQTRRADSARPVSPPALRLVAGGHRGSGSAGAVRARELDRAARPAVATATAATATALESPAARGEHGSRPRRSPVGRLAVAVLTVAAISAIWFGAGALRALGNSEGSVRLAGATSVSGGLRYVAEPGDSLWSIAVRVEPGEDPRALVDELEAQLHGRTLQPGDVLVLP